MYPVSRRSLWQTAFASACIGAILTGCGGSDSGPAAPQFRQQQLLVNNAVATDAATGQPLHILHVSGGTGGGNGSYESPFATMDAALAAAKSGDIVYVHTSPNLTFGGFTIPAGVRVLSSGVAETIATKQAAQVLLPLSSPGAVPLRPTITGTVVLNSDTTLAGFSVTTTAGSGVTGSEVTGNITVADNVIKVAGSQASGVALINSKDSVNVTVARNNVSGGTNNGILLDSEGTAQITASVDANIVSNNMGSGIFCFNHSGQITASITNNTVNGTQGLVPFDGGIRFGLFNAAQGTLTATGNTTMGNTANGIFVGSQETSHVTATLKSNTSTGNTGNGIFFGMQGASVGTATITANTTSGNKSNPAIAPFPSGNGIYVGAQESGQANADVNGNTSYDNADVGIFNFAANKGVVTSNVNRNDVRGSTNAGIEINVGLNGQPGNPASPGDAAQGSVQVVANNVQGNKGISPPLGGGGILVFALTTGTVRAQIDSNTLVDNATATGALGGIGLISVQQAHLFASLEKNTLFRNKGNNGEFFAASGLPGDVLNGATKGPSSIELRLKDNINDAAFVLLRAAQENIFAADTSGQNSQQVVTAALPLIALPANFDSNLATAGLVSQADAAR